MMYWWILFNGIFVKCLNKQESKVEWEILLSTVYYAEIFYFVYYENKIILEIDADAVF